MTTDRSAAELASVLLELVEDISGAAALATALKHVTEYTSRLIGIERVSLRLLDERRTRLLVAARSGPSVHHDERVEFKVGEGLIGWIVASNQPLRLANAEADPRFEQRSDQHASVASFLGAPMADESGCIGVLSCSATTPDRFTQADEELMRLVAGITAPFLQMGRLRRLANTDSLTAFLNRHALDEVLPESVPAEDHVSVVMIDIDHFKTINDRHGHAAGDDALRAVAAAITSVLRQLDCVVRIGGDEFLIVLPGASAEAACSIAERARARIAELAMVPGEHVTASAGVTQRRQHEARHDLLERVDAALYRAKALGRDRVVLE
jgi:diguanylate cyclase (GGDEF)-like protein